MAPTAEAHYIKTSNAEVGATGNFCLLGTSEISHGDGGGYAMIGSASYAADPGWVPCYFRNPNWIYQHALSVVVYYWSPYQRWEPCFGSQWFIYNGEVARTLSWQLHLACGSSWYTTVGYIYGRNGSNDNWAGNGVLSGSESGTYYHFLPA